MSCIALINGITLVLVLSALAGLIKSKDQASVRNVIQPLSLFLVIYSLTTLRNVLEWSGFNPLADLAGDLLQIGTPLLWYFFVILLSREGIFRVIQRQRLELSSLCDLSRILGETRDIPDLLSKALKKILFMFEMEAGAVFVYQNGRGVVDMVSVGFEDNEKDILSSLSGDKGMLQGMLDSGEIIDFDLSSAQVEYAEKLSDLGYRTATMSLIFYHGKDVGMVALFSRKTAFLQNEGKNLLRTVIAELGISLTNLSLYRDISLRVMEVEEALQEKRDMQSVIAHDLRAPLTVIMGYADIMERGDDDIPSKEYRRMLHIIRKRSKQLDRLITDFMDLTKMEAGSLVLRPEALEPVKHLRETIDEMDKTASGKDIRIGLKVKGEVGFVRADHDRFHQIFNNLVDNAIKYTPEGGRVTIYAWKENGLVHFVVEDTGIGIAEDQQEIIFEKYRRLSAMIVAGSQGAGLGLNIVRKFVQALDGDIWVKSSVGQGAQFHLILPQDVGVRDQGLEESPAAIEGSSREGGAFEGVASVLVIDDDRDFTEIITHLLSTERFLVRRVHDCFEGLKSLLDDCPDIIILDLMMPLLDGIDFCRLVRTMEKTSSVPILIVSALSDVEKREEARMAGADDYLAKPQVMEELIERIELLLSKKGK